VKADNNDYKKRRKNMNECKNCHCYVGEQEEYCPACVSELFIFIGGKAYRKKDVLTEIYCSVCKEFHSSSGTAQDLAGMENMGCCFDYSSARRRLL